MIGYYILVNGQPKESNFREWETWFDTADRTVAQTSVDNIKVTTAFLGLDRSCVCGGVPMLYKTFVFVGSVSVESEEYSTVEEALLGHKRIVALITAVAARRSKTGNNGEW